MITRRMHTARQSAGGVLVGCALCLPRLDRAASLPQYSGAFPVTTSLRAVGHSVNGWNAEFLLAEYDRFKADPASVPEDLRAFLQGFDLAMSGAAGGVGGAGGVAGHDLRIALATAALVDAYRRHGHLLAKLNPFGEGAGLDPESIRPTITAGIVAQLDPASTGLTPADLQRPAAGIPGLSFAGTTDGTVGDVLARLRATYAGTTAWQFMHITDPEVRAWWGRQIETAGPVAPMSGDDARSVSELLCRAAHLEQFLQARYQGQKRFSLEGGESLIPFLDFAIREACSLGTAEVVMGMAHRGRLNVLAHVLRKTYAQIFTDFEHNYREEFIDGGGDVKYHKGYSTERTMADGKRMHVSLNSNPSHLESVNAVVCGRSRGKQRLRCDTKSRRSVLPVLIHGDAAVIGQGVVAELLTMSRLEGYTTGGTLHVVTNNLVGFTTDADDGRSGPYCTDVALMGDCPVIHVNGTDVPAVLRAARLAVQFRQTFGRDVWVDIYCYRKHGHNEQDNFSFTQPLLAELIKNEKGVLARFADDCAARGLTGVTAKSMESLREELQIELDKAQTQARARPVPPNIEPGGERWAGLVHEYSHEPVKTSVTPELLAEVCSAFTRFPDGFTVNTTLQKLVDGRAGLAALANDETGPMNLNYADGEHLALGTLLLEGTPVRISGQDARRGTFAHRHAVLRDAVTGEPFTPLNNLRPIVESPDDIDHKKLDAKGATDKTGRRVQARLCVYNSPLSEFAVMGFDYGYALADPHMLVCWEAQFGDFVNGAQVIIDQYLASAEIKWDRWCGLTLLLPHGYEGAGPEHSSARLERFLQLCADDNIQVVYPSTGAQIFHLLRRQVRRNFRKPLVVMTPKSMLRPVNSRVSDLVKGSFREILDDPFFEAKPAERKLVSRIVLCTGKVYHELAARRDALNRRDTALIRVEQLYPLHRAMLEEVLKRYPAKAEAAWCQEEPRNAGAFQFINDLWQHELGRPGLKYYGRPPSATPAVGDTHASDVQQDELLTAAIGPRVGAPASGAPGSHGTAPGHTPSPSANGAPKSPATEPKHAPASKPPESKKPSRK